MKYNASGKDKNYKKKICVICKLPFKPRSGRSKTCNNFDCELAYALDKKLEKKPMKKMPLIPDGQTEKIELKLGEIYQKQGTLDVRTISWINRRFVCYYVWGGIKEVIWRKSFIDWIRRNKGRRNEVMLIGICNFDTGKVRVV